LRLATALQQQYNKRLQKNNTSGYKGVQRGRNGHGWQANIRAAGYTRYLGQYPTKEEAAAAYDRAARQYHGEFALTNERINPNAV